VTSYLPEEFSDAEQAVLRRFVTNLDAQVFALRGLSEEVAAALFARYSRTAKSLRRVLLDEFAGELAGLGPVQGSSDRARALMARVVGEYGDDSVAQLGVAHVAVEQVSTVLTRTLERQRLVSFLEQSTRYVPLDRPRRDGSFRAVIPEELSEGDAPRYERVLALLFGAYQQVLQSARAHFGALVEAEDLAAQRAARAAALDVARACLPLATMSNVGMVGSAQALEAMVARLRAEDTREAQRIATQLATELEGTLGSLVSRMNRSDRGWATVRYRRGIRAALAPHLGIVRGSPASPEPVRGPVVRLIELSPRDERTLVPWMLYEEGDLAYSEVAQRVESLDDTTLAAIVAAYIGERRNRRHRPSRALEMARYVFEIEADWGAFRDLARHRMLTLMEQRPSPAAGYDLDATVVALGLAESVDAVFTEAFALASEFTARYPRPVADAILPMATRVRFVLALNARELMHVVELRSQPQGHPHYRAIAQELHRLVRAHGHERLADAMWFVDHSSPALGRLAQEARTLGAR
jgi:thymidylate synthase ThyX